MPKNQHGKTNKHKAGGGYQQVEWDQYAPGGENETQHTPSGINLNLRRRPPACEYRARQHQDDGNAPRRGKPKEVLGNGEIICRQAWARPVMELAPINREGVPWPAACTACANTQ